jgi:RHS repeat-associated protein
VQLDGRTFSSSDYRYGFNGMEADDEVKGQGNSYTTEYRQYDSRLGRWTSLDPLMGKFSNQSPYVAFDNNPIMFIDPDGRAPQDHFLINKNGTIDVIRNNDKFDTYSVATSNTENPLYIQVAQLEKNEYGLVKFPEIGKGFNQYGQTELGGFSSGTKKGKYFEENVGSGDSYLKPETAAALVGVISELNDKGLTISLGDMSASNGSDPANAGKGTFHHGGHGHMGARSGLDIDFRYIGGDGNSYRGVMNDNRFNSSNNQGIYNAASRFGFDPINTYQGTTGNLSGVKKMGGHENHGHLGFKNKPTNINEL